MKKSFGTPWCLNFKNVPLFTALFFSMKKQPVKGTGFFIHCFEFFHEKTTCERNRLIIVSPGLSQNLSLPEFSVALSDEVDFL